MEKTFILKTIDRCNGTEENYLLGNSFKKIIIDGKTVFEHPYSLPKKFKEEFESYIKQSDVDESTFGEMWQYPSSQVFIIDSTEDEMISIDSDSIKAAYITCNGTTIEKLPIIPWPEDWDLFWIGFLENNKKFIKMVEEKYKKQGV